MDGARRSGVRHWSWHAPLLSQEHIISILQCFDGSSSELEVQVRCEMQHATCDENHDATCIMQRSVQRAVLSPANGLRDSPLSLRALRPRPRPGLVLRRQRPSICSRATIKTLPDGLYAGLARCNTLRLARCNTLLPAEPAHMLVCVCSCGCLCVFVAVCVPCARVCGVRCACGRVGVCACVGACACVRGDGCFGAAAGSTQSCR